MGITQLDAELSNIRKRPGMYIGDTGRYGLYHLLYFALDAVVEAGARKLSVVLHRDDTTEISASATTYDVSALVDAQRAGRMHPAHDMMSVVATLTDPFFV